MTKILELTRSTVLLGAESSTMGAEATSFIELLAPLEMTDWLLVNLVCLGLVLEL